MSGNDRQRLDSWKDIAKYLGRDLSTVRRWEKDKGLPVHRVPGGSRHAVFAFVDEINSWLAGNPAEGSGESLERIRPPLARRAGYVIAALIFVLAVFSVWRGIRQQNIDRAEFQGQKLIARDDAGRTVWEYKFSAPLDIPEGQSSRRLHLTDLNGDGYREVVAGLRYAGSEEEEVYCFSDRGVLIWKYRPSQTLVFGGRTYAGPWKISAMVLPDTPDRQLWVAFVHHTWWPSFVVRIDGTGSADLRFVSAGWVTELELFRNGSGSYVVAAGLNNEYDAGALAIIDPSRQAVSSPQSPGSPYQCSACPQANPHRYFVFPRSELNAITGSPANIVRTIRTLPDKLEVRTEEVHETSVQSFGVYEFSSDFVLLGASMTDLYWDLHRRLEKEGRLSHGADLCLRQQFKDRIRVWRGDDGQHAGIAQSPRF